MSEYIFVDDRLVKKDSYDVGSWKVTKNEDGKKEYMGFYAEKDLLPKNNVASGSTALCLDTCDVLIFHENDMSWHLL